MESELLEVEFRMPTDRQKAIEELADLCVHLGRAVAQNDFYFKEAGGVDAVQRPGSFILRLRQNSRVLLTRKALTRQKGVWEEDEVEVHDFAAMMRILSTSGFCQVLTIRKTRRRGEYKGIEISLDRLAGRGWFIEVSLKVPASKVRAARRRLRRFLTEKLGARRQEIESRGYGRILFEEAGVEYQS